MSVKTVKTLELEEWELDTPTAMLECLEELVDKGYRGQVRVFSADEVVIWDLEIGIGNTAVLAAQLGQVAVLLGGVLEAITKEQYAERFGE